MTDTRCHLAFNKAVSRIGPQYRAFRDRPDIRMPVVGNYRLIYQIDEDGLRVIAFPWGGSRSALG